jgi:putative inorganic carbon (HCO3(-)) transporter
VTVLAAINGPAPKLGVIAAALLVALVLLARNERIRAWAMLGTLVLAPVLLLADIWNSPQLRVVHHHPLETAIGAGVALALVGVAAWVIAQRTWVLGPLAVLALPFRIPISTSGTTHNLLVPLYAVVAAGTLAVAVPILLDDREHPPRRPPGWVERLLAATVVLYAIQAVYSANFETGLQQMVFFYAPFALMFTLLVRLDWNRELIVRCLQVVAGLAVLFACIGFVEYATKHLLLNPKVIAANASHPYFSINSVFFDPDIFGRFLALVMILLAALVLYSRDQRLQVGSTVVLAILWGGLVLTLSRSSLAALLVGLGVLLALRFKVWPVVATGVAIVGIGAIVIAASPNTFGLNQGLNGASAGRSNLVSGGFQMWADRPLWGYGSGAFVTEYRRQHPHSASTVSASHTIPITVAAEQGLIGLAVYIPLIVMSVLTLARGAREDPVRAAILAAWLAFVFHTMLYADFLEDPVSWALLAIGTTLALASTGGDHEPQQQRVKELAL